MIAKEQLNEWLELYKKTKDQNLLEKLLCENEGLVRHVLKKFQGHPDYEDLLQEGRIGLIDAIQRYDPDTGSTFSTFAYHCIFGRVNNYLSENFTVRMPRYISCQLFALARYQNNGMCMSDEEIATEMKVSLEKLKELKEYQSELSLLSLDAPYGLDESDEVCLKDVVSATEEKEMLALENEEIRQALFDVVKSNFPDPQQLQIVEQIFGIGCNPKGIQAIAQEKNLARWNVLYVIRKLRHPKIQMEIRRSLGIPRDVKKSKIADYLFCN